MTTFDRVMDHILRWEGGYVNDPRDPGGETKYGISKRAHPNVDIKALTVEAAKDIYRADYWEPLGAEGLAFPEALALMDFGVHSGVGTAEMYWQISVDAWELQQQRVDYLVSLKDFPTYGRGWMRRVRDLDDILRSQVVPTDFELVQVYSGDKVIEFKPTRVSVGPSRHGRRKLMARLD